MRARATPATAAMPSVHEFETPDQAEAAFYAAFSSGDLDQMMAVWALDDGIVCLHPGDGRREGQSAVRGGWQEIMAEDQARFAVTPSDVLRQTGETLSVHTLRELLWVDGQLRGVMLATNIYLRVHHGWRLWLHQAQPDPQGRELVAAATSSNRH
ncbi:MAG: YybH family protein [Thiotrichales bacterium]